MASNATISTVTTSSSSVLLVSSPLSGAINLVWPTPDCLVMVVGSKSMKDTSSLTGTEVVLVIVLFGIAVLLLMLLANRIRSYVYREEISVETVFTGGGELGMGMLATRTAAMSTWAATFLATSGLTVQYGICGAYYYGIAVTTMVIFFSIFTLQMRLRAPGATTYLQVIRARFGPLPHLLYCIIALLNSTIVLALLMLGGCAVITQFTSDLSLEVCTALIVCVVGVFSLAGGMGSAFYVSYVIFVLSIVIVCLFVFSTFNRSSTEVGILGDLRYMYNLLFCRIDSVQRIRGTSLAFASLGGFLFEVINVIGVISLILSNQPYWQASASAKPNQAVYGFIFGGLIWFSLPFCFGTACGLAYLALGVVNGGDLLTGEQVSAGLVPLVVARHLFGHYGQVALILICVMAITITGSAQIMAMTSIFIFDIHAVYIKPFRRNLQINFCILCGKQRSFNALDKCVCQSMAGCEICQKDNRIRRQDRLIRIQGPSFTCSLHGPYRRYKEYLRGLIPWLIIIIAFFLIPLTLLLNAGQVRLVWLYQLMGLFLAPPVPSICLMVTWGRLTGPAMTLGLLGGVAGGLSSWLVYTAYFDTGYKNFFDNSASLQVLLVSNAFCFGLGLTIPIVVSLLTTRDRSTKLLNPDSVWDCVQDIDNPLKPWPEVYAKELRLINPERLADGRPCLYDIKRAFKDSVLASILGTVILWIGFYGIWLGSGVAINQFDYNTFSNWIFALEVYMLVSLVISLIPPLVEEVIAVKQAMRQNLIDDFMYEEALKEEAERESRQQMSVRMHLLKSDSKEQLTTLEDEMLN